MVLPLIEGLEYSIVTSVRPTFWCMVAVGLGCGVVIWACIAKLSNPEIISKEIFLILESVYN
jgi:hypothetical protein